MKTQERIKTPTIKDIASACGVSAATVSYVINGKSVLRPDTRERIFKAMREMNYFPNALARGLQTKSMFAIGVMLATVDPSEFIVNPYTSSILQGVLQEARRQQFQVMLFTNDWIDAENSGATIKDGRTDGLLVVAPKLDSDILTSLPDMQPNVVAISAPSNPKVDVVDVDDRVGGRLAVEHLVAFGHRRIGYLTGNADMYSHEPRLFGYRDALAAAGIAYDPGLVHVSRFDGSLAASQTRKLLSSPDPPTAIFAGNDTMAITVIEELAHQGLSVPHDVSVIGYDDMPAAALVTPKLTTVRQPLMEIGVTATRLLIERILAGPDARGKPANTILLEPVLVARQSSGSVRGSR